MTDLVEITIDNIEINIMAILLCNMDIKFSHFSLYNKLLNDKYDSCYTNFIHPNFKAKYLLILRNLMSKYDDVLITKEKKNYYIIYISDKYKKYEDYNNNHIKDIDVDLSKYIIDNDIKKEFKYIDPYDGNTIYHDLVMSNNFDIIKKMIESHKFDYLSIFIFEKIYYCRILLVIIIMESSTKIIIFIHK